MRARARVAPSNNCLRVQVEAARKEAEEQLEQLREERTKLHDTESALAAAEQQHSDAQAGTFSHAYGSILAVILPINGVPCCWDQH